MRVYKNFIITRDVRFAYSITHPYGQVLNQYLITDTRSPDLDQYEVDLNPEEFIDRLLKEEEFKEKLKDLIK